MIAYNHYIKFIPELENDKKVEGSFTDIITVQENLDVDLDEKLLYELTFFNNQGRDLMLYTDSDFAIAQKVRLLAFEIKDIVTFFWYSDTLILEYIPHRNFTEELLKYWCLHIVLPVFFTIEETYDFFHAGAVEVEGKPILFVAESFGGKSTITDFFMEQGHTMVSDDKVAMYEKNGEFFAVSSHSHHRPYRNVEDLGYFVDNFASEPKLLHAIYELEKAEEDDEIVITELQGIEKFKSLRYASEMNLYFLKSKRFEYLTKLAKVVPVFKVKVPWKIDRLNEVYQLIIKNNRVI